MLALTSAAVKITMDLVTLAKRKRSLSHLAEDLAFADVRVTATVCGVRMSDKSLVEVDPETFADRTPAEIATMALSSLCRGRKAKRVHSR